MNDAISISSLRTEFSETLEVFGRRIGLSKSQMHEVEKTNRASLRVALAIETLSEGRIDAAGLCEEVRLARRAVHDVDASAVAAAPSPGKNADLAASQQSEAA